MRIEHSNILRERDFGVFFGESRECGKDFWDTSREVCEWSL